MSNINVSPSSDQTSNIFQLANFVNAEVVTSAKLNVWSQQINNEFGVLSGVVGNTFIHGLSNLGAAVGNLKGLTQPVVSSNNFIGVKPALFDGSNTLLNDMPATVGSLSGGQYPITITGGGVIGTQNIIGTSGAVPIINIAIVQKDGNGNVTTVYPGSFLTPSSYAGGTVSQFNAVFGDVITPGSNFYVLAVNYSLADVLAQAVTNVGDMSFGRSTGYIDSSDNIQNTLGGVPTVTAELNSLENKTFAIKWHAVLSFPGTIVGANNVWTTTASTTTFQSGSSPNPASVKSYISNLGTGLVIPANNNVGRYVSANGAAVMSGGSVLQPTVTYDGTTLTISIPTSALANVTTSTIDVYFPALVPVRLLQSNNLSYTDEHTRVADLFKTVIGAQYAWTQSPYPNTIANRLDSDEATLNALTTTVTSLGGLSIPNGSFEVSSNGTSPDKWTTTALSNGSFALDTSAGNFIHGAQSIKFTVNIQGASFGGGFVESLDFIPISVQTSLYLKWKVKSSATNVSNKVDFEFYNAAKTLLGTTTIWDNAGVSTTSWATQYGGVLSSALPANTCFLKVKLTGGYLSSQLGSTWYDGVEFFVPSIGYTGVVFTTSGTTTTTTTFTTGSNTVNVLVSLIGGGGGGGAGSTNNGSFNSSGAGGGAGGCIKAPVPVNPDTTYTVVIGGGGAGGGSHGSSGSTGSASKFKDGATVLLQANGGNGGGGATPTVPGTGGSGGSSSFSGINQLKVINHTNGSGGSNGTLGAGSDNTTGGAGGGLNTNGNPYLSSSGGQGNTPGGGGSTFGPPSGVGAGGGGGAGGNFNYPANAGAPGEVLIEY